MATPNSVKTKIQGLIDVANKTTGKRDTNLTSGVNSLIKGYGQQGGTTPDNSEMEALFAVAPFMAKASVGHSKEFGMGVISTGAFVLQHVAKGYYGILVFLPFITEISEDFSWASFTPMNIIFTSKVPPTLGKQRGWDSYPHSMFVPDESIDAYKTATNFAEYAHKMKPLSTYNGEGYNDWDDEVVWR